MPPRQKTSTDPSVSPAKRTSAGILTLSKTTPLRAAQSGLVPYSFKPRLNAIVVYDRISEDMKDCFLGSMPYMEMLDEFHPVTGEREPLPKLVFHVPLPCEDNPRNGMSVYDDTVADVCRAINESGVCPSIIFMDTENVYIDMNGTLASNDPQGKRKVDASGMLRPGPNEKNLPVEPNWARMKVTLEFKRVPEDPVVDPDPDMPEEKKKEQGYVHQTPNAIHARGQATSYALHQFNFQPRTHVTSLVFIGRWARLLRYDHSGVVVSERFDWRADGGRLLVDFLSRLEHASAKEEGIDDSIGDVSIFSEEQLAEARVAMQKFSDGMIDVPITDETTLRSVTCWDDDQLDANGVPKSRTLISTMPFGINYSIVGRYTVSFIGYDPHTCCAYWVKDSWPIDRPKEFEKEGATYKRLKDAGVPHIADVECAGEVRWQEDGTIQKTRTNAFTKASWAALTHNIHPLSHYRILFKTIGRPVTKFESTLQLVRALSHAVQAHSLAYEKANILHRDISPGNILIDRDGNGRLIDWDLALLYDDDEKDIDDREPRTSWRTGTWAFLSCALLAQPFGKAHELSDDLESFFWVLLYTLLRYRYSPVKWIKPEHDRDFQDYLLDLFEWKRWKFSHELQRTVCVGGREKRLFLRCDADHISKIDLGQMQDRQGVQMPRPLRKLLTQLRADLKKFYDPPTSDSGSDVEALIADADELPQPPRPPKASKERARFASSAHIMERFTTALAESGWLDADGTTDRFPFIHLPLQTRQKLEKEAVQVLRTQSDNPESIKRRRTKNDLLYKASEEQLAAEARARVGGPVMKLPRKRTRDALDPVPEEDEVPDETTKGAGPGSIALRRRPVPKPTKRRRLGPDDEPLEDGGEAWSGGVLKTF